MIKSETIAAIATSLSDAGIGIVRISGDQAIEIGNRIYRSKNGCHSLKDYGSHTIHYGFIVDGEDILDEVMVSVMKAPATYTKEDVVEINCHGGVLVCRKILECVLANGARMAEPGEFTKRAFLNGRIDLSEAEAVMDVIHSSNEYALKISEKQLRGAVSEKIHTLRDKIIYELAFIESALDDPEHISTEGYPEKLSGILNNLDQQITTLINSAENGRLIKEGVRTVIVGRTNAGKSSLLNLLCGEERAIVTDIEGTTRDSLEEHINLDGISLNIIDTAGIRQTEDIVEKIGVERAIRAADEADLLLYVVDSSASLCDDDRQIMKMIGDKKCIVLLNKSDLKNRTNEEDIKGAFEVILKEKQSSFTPDVISISAATGYGVEKLTSAIKKIFFEGHVTSDQEIVITGMRHKAALIEARDSLRMVMRSIEAFLPEDFYSIDLMSAYAALGKITGESVEDDLVEEIFSKFCMGK